VAYWIPVCPSATDLSVRSGLRHGQLIWHFDAWNDVVILSYKDLVLETDADVAWFEQECEEFWRRFHDSTDECRRGPKDLLVDLGGIQVKPAVAGAWNMVRERMVQKHLRKTYRFGGERRTLTAIHLGEVLQKTDGTTFANREQAFAALLADRAKAKQHP
jgi:hypothetical protein